MHTVEFTIREPKRHWLLKVFVAAAFSGFFTYLVHFFTTSTYNTAQTWTFITYFLWFFGVLFVFLIPLIARHYIHFNFSKLKIKHSYAIGMLTYNESWQDLKNLEYISVFKTQNGYEINMWFDKNDILNLAALTDADEAINQGLFFSEKLKIDLLDARKRGYHKWVDKVASRNLGKIVYSK
ncbi:hypothetical protein PK35_03490 [Tamlana nanhaiensis]|uniref:Uncharacterized protein n=1 Tax=Neotamlana nanhaiensis TaxID=1382798 RepID=A0A0D7W3Y0_9FLAO|nr:hypothetical protein [Tamlana nanhaiensis]KJD33825.1 hypothetical protein PK35_03490 [Tamlana nanhaiensis]